MEITPLFLDFILHIDRHLKELVVDYGRWVYVILFVIVFLETGFVVTPFLPGDSLLFAAGALAGTGVLELPVILAVFTLAALAGDNVNYFVGRTLGPRILRSDSSRFLNRKHLDRTHAFFEKHGGKTIIMARFVPIVRTFTPFVAGIGAMTYARFLAFSVAGALLWVGICVGAGYLFGRIPAVQNNFTLAVLGVVAVSMLPAVVEIARHLRARRTKPGTEAHPEG